MFKFNNTHIFTGYLKQKLSSVNIPTCKIYSNEFAAYKSSHGVEDPRIVESFSTVQYGKDDQKVAVNIPYLRNNEVYNYFADTASTVLKTNKHKGWVRANNLCYDSDNFVPGLTKTLKSPGRFYDTETHEYLGDYLRFLRDYHNINLMSLYNCFNNNICNNLTLSFYSDARKYDVVYENAAAKPKEDVEFISQDSKYKIYAIPVKLFSNYTIAIDSHQGIEICCGLYNKHLYYPGDSLADCKAQRFSTKTYMKVGKAIFGQPILFDKLNVEYWLHENELKEVEVDGKKELRINTSNKILTRWDLISREHDLRMFIKVPASCKSSIVVLEGDFRNYNDVSYVPNPDKNLIMEGCCVGRRLDKNGEPMLDSNNEEKLWTITGAEPERLQKYQLSDWQYSYFGDGAVWEAEATAAETKQPNVLVPSIYFIEASENMNVWTQNETAKPAFVETLNYCEISNAAELAYVVHNKGKVLVTDASGKERTIKTFKLVNDIYINDPTKINWDTGELINPDSDYTIRNWFTVNANNKTEGFSGVIEGDGHTIFGLYIHSSDPVEDYAGLIPLIDADSTTSLKNIGMNYLYIKGSSYSAAFVGGVSTSKIPLDRWKYIQNHSVTNLLDREDYRTERDYNDAMNDTNGFKPISKLQLLEFNTGESYPFADRLVEYMVGSVITPIDEIPDNIKRAQKIMKQNNHRFKIEGLWENKMQKILYDYIMNAGPIEIVDDRLVDKRAGYQSRLGHNYKSVVYDIIGYVDRDAEKWYASSKKGKDKKVIQETISSADIYDGLYDI